jgi:hypothetical protein
MKNYLKGIAVAILIGLAAYAVINGVRLGERYIEAKELEARYKELEARYKVVNYQNDYILIIDKKERKAYYFEGGEFKLLGDGYR